MSGRSPNYPATSKIPFRCSICGMSKHAWLTWCNTCELAYSAERRQLAKQGKKPTGFAARRRASLARCDGCDEIIPEITKDALLSFGNGCVVTCDECNSDAHD